MNLIEAFEEGKVEGFNSMPDQDIETVISRIFFFGDRVYKIYKFDFMDGRFGEFKTIEQKKKFCEEDFFWNKAMSPEVYLNLHGARKDGDKFILANIDQGEEFIIEMRKIDSGKNLIDLMIQNKVDDQDLKRLIQTLVPRLRELTIERKDSLNYLVKKPFLDLMIQDLEDLRDWAYMSDKHIPREKTDEIINILINFVKNEAYYKNYDKKNLSACIDNHGYNILIFNDRINLLDIVPPKENWRLADEIASVSRPITDVSVILGKEKADLMYDEYKKISPAFPEKIRTFSDVRSAMIMTSYLHALHKHSLAEKYMNFVEQNVRNL